MIAIPNERLRERAREKVMGLELAITQTAFADSRAELEEELELSRIALASLEAEPVAYTDAEELRFPHATSDMWPVPLGHGMDLPLYTAPPSPVAPDLKELEEILDWILMLPCPTPKATHFAKRLAVVIDTCRAAMLQGAEPVSQPYTLRDGLAAIRSLGGIDAEKIQAERDALNEPAQGWIACSERMPEKGQKVFYYFDIVGVHAGYYDGDNTFVKENGGGWLTGDVTHWMEWILPAAPQQEVKPAIEMGMTRYGDAMQKLADGGD